MSARLAAAALVTFDVEVAQAIRRIHAEHGDRTASWAEAEALAQQLRSSWTLGLAAHAGGATEEKVVAAVLLYFVGAGPSALCRRIARQVFKRSV